MHILHGRCLRWNFTEAGGLEGERTRTLLELDFSENFVIHNLCQAWQ
jgi:hypothetical protein